MNVSGVLMKNSIELYGVQTHNLKKISVTIPKNKITVIYGRSGAGKSSLAFSTLHKLCLDEFEAMENGFNDNQDYQLSAYNGIIPSVAVTQNNSNNNPRSTLYSFLNIAQIISSIQTQNTIPYALLKLNKPQNECTHCHGLGEISEVSPNELIEQNKTILENPFKIWQKGYLSELYYKLMLSYCELEGIPLNLPYSQLSEVEQHKLLYGHNAEKLSIRFKHNGKYRQRRLPYQGVIENAEERIKSKSVSSLQQTSVCPSCLGTKVNKNYYSNIKLNNINFIDFLHLPISELQLKFKDSSDFFYLSRIFSSICEMGLGYLNLSRSIPSLSGGELQKLKFSRILNSSISGILLVIDEISSQLSDEYLPIILGKLKEISGKNTVVLVEHNPYFIKNAEYKLHIGRFSGKEGGYICDHEVIQAIDEHIQYKQSTDFFKFQNINKNNIHNQAVRIPKKLITVLTGVSGSGKSSLAKWIENNEKAIYVTQKNSNFSSRSVLASSLKVNTIIADYLSKNTGLDESDFLLHKNAGCKICNGIGVLKYERGFEKDIYLNCYQCNGKLFDEHNPAIHQKVDGLSLYDFYQKEINKLVLDLPKSFHSLSQILETAISLGLGHLQLSRKTQTLSGGETRRLKLCEHLSRRKETNKILIIDEPAAGLDPETASKVAHFIRQKTELFSAVILIEHRREVVKYADYEIRIGPFAGDMGGEIMSQEFITTCNSPLK